MAEVLKRTVRAHVRTTVNASPRYDQQFLSSDVAFTKIAQHRVVLAANPTQSTTPGELDMSNITVGKVLWLSTDRPITVYLNQTGPTFSRGIVLGTSGMLMLVGLVLAVYVLNMDADYTATVEFLVTD
jgi:hypothetical protein